MSRIKLLLLLGLFVLPVAASYLTYYILKPEGRKNYGELVKQVDLQIKGTDLSGNPFDFAQLKGSWVMVYAGGGACDESCKQLLYFMRQTRKVQGKEMDRIERVWLITDGLVPDAGLQAEHEGLKMVRVEALVAAKQLAGAEEGGYLYMADPLGHLMMRWPRNPDPSSMVKDIRLLLKASQIG